MDVSATIRALRIRQGLTQQALAERISVSAKTVSKWETGKGLPDVALFQPLAEALGASVTELMRGQPVANGNRGNNLLRSKLYVCPVCGNVIHAVGEALISCCGVTLPPLTPAEPDPDHALTIQPVEDEYCLTLAHPMEKGHHMAFIAFLTGDRLTLQRLYPEGSAETRMRLRGAGTLCWYCTGHGLFGIRWRRPTKNAAL